MSGAPAPAEQPVQPTPAAAQNTEPGQTQEQTIPYTRFKEVNDQLGELRRKEQEREARERAAADKRAKEQGQYQELLETRTKELDELRPQVETATGRIKAFEDVMSEQVKERVKLLGDDARKAFAMLGDDVLVQFKALPTFERMAGTAPRSTGTSAGPRGSGAQTSAGAPSLDAIKDDKRARIGGL